MREERQQRWYSYGKGKVRRAVVTSVAVMVGTVLLGLCPGQAGAIIALRPDLELEGVVQAETILRTPNFADAKFILQRNTAQLEARDHFLQESQAFGWLQTRPFEDGTFTVIGRGVYDSIYDIGDAFSDKFTQQEKEKRKFEYKLREIYMYPFPLIHFSMCRLSVYQSALVSIFYPLALNLELWHI